MRKEIRLRGRNWYANTRFMGELLQDCLDTSDEKIARRRLEHLKTMIERGEYQVSKKKFGELASQYLNEVLIRKSKASQVRYESIVRYCQGRNKSVPAWRSKSVPLGFKI